MKRSKSIMAALVILFMCSAVFGTVVYAAHLSSSKKIVVFHEKVTWGEIKAYAQEWQSSGVSLVMELEFINALVLSVPGNISSADLADDPRVHSVEENQPVQIQAVYGAADGGAADGGAADGGAADGGAADGGAADGGAADGGAADGGAADGGAADGGAADGGAADGGAQVSPPWWSFIEPVSKPPKNHRPWGILEVFDQLQSPGLLTDSFDSKDTPWLIRLALRGVDKQRISVAVLDTGVDFTHPSLAERVKDGFDAITMTPGLTMDDNGHGTHIAGTLCSRLDDVPFGLVPKVELYSVKILDRYAMGDLSNIIMGLKWAIDNKMDIVNMSIAYREDSEAVRLAVQKAHQAGVVMVAAAGNHSNWDAPAPVAAADGGAADGGAADGGAADGGAADGGAADGGAADGGSADGGAADGGAADGGSADGGAVDGGAADGGSADGGAADGGAADGGAADGGAAKGQQDVLPWYSVMYPARYKEVIAVGASNSFGEMAEFTNYGDALDLVAPGTDIVSTNVFDWGGFGVCSGTSMATPHVTGAVAMMLALDPDLSPREIITILKETAEELESIQGVKGLDLTSALRKVASGTMKKAWRRKTIKKAWRRRTQDDD